MNKYSLGYSRNSSPFMVPESLLSLLSGLMSVYSPSQINVLRMSAKGSIMIEIYKKYIITRIVLSVLNATVYIKHKKLHVSAILQP